MRVYHPVNTKLICICTYLVVPNMYSWRCTVAAVLARSGTIYLNRKLPYMCQCARINVSVFILHDVVYDSQRLEFNSTSIGDLIFANTILYDVVYVSQRLDFNSTIIGDVMFSKADCYWNLYKLDNLKRKKRKFYEQPDTKHTWTLPILYDFHEDTSTYWT